MLLRPFLLATSKKEAFHGAFCMQASRVTRCGIHGYCDLTQLRLFVIPVVIVQWMLIDHGGYVFASALT